MTSFAGVLSTLLTLALSTAAETPSEQEQIGLEILITVSIAVGDCESLLFDSDRIETVIAGYGVKQSDVTGRYRDFSVAYASDLTKAADADPVKFCVYALGTFGPRGTIPGLIVRR